MNKPKALILALMLIFGLRTQAALQFDVFIGFDGVVHEGEWFPVTCEVFNDGPGFNGVIEISGGPFSSDQSRLVPVELPTNTRKRIYIPVFASGGRFGGGWEARLKDGSGKVLAERQNPQVKTVAWESTVLGAVPRSFSGMPNLPDVQQNRQDLKPEAARMGVEQFPDNPIALEGLNALYLNSEKAVDLKVNQVNALIAWVRGGGHLILGVEQLNDVNGTPWMKQFIPMDLTDTANLKLESEFADWIKSEAAGSSEVTLQVRPGGRRKNSSQPQNAYVNLSSELQFADAQIPVATGTVKEAYTLIANQGIPLVVQAPRGRGKITLLTFSPEREPFRSWKNRSYFWAKLSGIPGELFSTVDQYGYSGSSIDGVFGALIDSRQIKKLPVTWLLLLLVVYLLVIGPFDQWWLKRIGKQMLTWITFPAYVVLFSLLIYFIGYKLRAGETEWNELNVVDVLPRGDKVDLRGHTYISVYSSGNANYPLEGEKGYATLRGELTDRYGGGREASKARIVQEGNSFKADIFVPVWTSLLYVNDWLKTNSTPFVASVSDNGSHYQVDLQNLMDQRLDNVRVVVNQAIFELEPLQPNEKKSVQLDPAKGVAIRTWVQQNGVYFRGAIDRRRNPLGDTSGGQLEDRPLTATVASFISHLNEAGISGRNFISPAGMDLTPQVERGDAVVFAWLPNFGFEEKVNRFNPPRYRRDTLLRLSVGLKQKNAI